MCDFLKNVSYENFHDATFSAHEIVDRLQVRISKNLMIHAH